MSFKAKGDWPATKSGSNTSSCCCFFLAALCCGNGWSSTNTGLFACLPPLGSGNWYCNKTKYLLYVSLNCLKILHDVYSFVQYTNLVIMIQECSLEKKIIWPDFIKHKLYKITIFRLFNIFQRMKKQIKQKQIVCQEILYYLHSLGWYGFPAGEKVTDTAIFLNCHGNFLQSSISTVGTKLFQHILCYSLKNKIIIMWFPKASHNVCLLILLWNRFKMTSS